MRTRDDVVGDPLVVEVEQRLVVDQDVPAPRPVLQLLDLGEQARLSAKNLWCVRQSPSTSALRMNSSRLTSGSIRP